VIVLKKRIKLTFETVEVGGRSHLAHDTLFNLAVMTEEHSLLTFDCPCF